MSRYIDADALKMAMSLYRFSSPYQTIIEFVEDTLSTADVKTVVRGTWLNTTHGVMCSACESIQVYGSRYYKYCPICGARMVKE